jgi:hypothetical protein
MAVRAHRPTRRTALAVVALALVLAACGGDDDAAVGADTTVSTDSTVTTDSVPSHTAVPDPAAPTTAPPPSTAPPTTVDVTDATCTDEVPVEDCDDTPGGTADSVLAPLADGRHFGFVPAVDLDARTVTFDLAQWLTGEAANEAAIADGSIEAGDTVPNDYYVVNDNPRLRDVSLADDVGVLLVDWSHCCAVVGSTLDVLAEVTGTTDALTEGFRNVPGQTGYWLTVDGGEIVAIEEQYRP